MNQRKNPASLPISLVGSAIRAVSRRHQIPRVQPIHPPTRFVRMTPDELTGPEDFYVTRRVLNSIRSTIGQQSAEQGGMLGGRRKRGVVTHFHFDDSASRTSLAYSPDTARINQLLKHDWNPNGVDLLGFVHSHPAGNRRPSFGDMTYAARILDAIPGMDRMCMPIVQTIPDVGGFSLHPYFAHRSDGGSSISGVDLRVISDHGHMGTVLDPVFARVTDAYDLKALAGLRLVIVGTGGAAAFAESMARAGVGEFVLIDPDTIEAPNLGTQQVYRADIGRAKIDAIAERILDINRHAHVVGVQCLLDELTDDMVRRLVHRPLPNSATLNPEATILCGFTDSFEAQARVNRLALNFGVPMVAAQVYPSGIGVEVSFHVPGMSVACGRCVLGSRYRAFLNDPSALAGVSQGTPLWATERLNELKSMIVLAIAHGVIPGDPDNPGRRRYESLLERIATRNLVQVRLHPEAHLPAFDKAFANADLNRIVTDETLWLPQQPENPDTGFESCGDCGGTGDLGNAVGTILDSRLPQTMPYPARAVPRLVRQG
jgi:proteasome lid subunit RPN8/RPN11